MALWHVKIASQRPPAPQSPSRPHRYPQVSAYLRSSWAQNSISNSLIPLFSWLWRLLALFFHLASFVFNRLQPLFRKQPGWGGAQPPAPPTSPRSNISIPLGGPMTANSAPLAQPGHQEAVGHRMAAPHRPLRTSNPNSPKWSIIPAPVSPTRLRGRSA